MKPLKIIARYKNHIAEVCNYEEAIKKDQLIQPQPFPYKHERGFSLHISEADVEPTISYEDLFELTWKEKENENSYLI